MDINLPEFKFAEFIVRMKLEEDSPFKKEYFLGAAIRGSLMFKAKKLLCANPAYFNRCERCILSGKCVYAKLFETMRPPDASVMRKYREIPKPYAMVPLKENLTVNLHIVLFGDYVSYFPYFYLVLKSLETKKHFKIHSVMNSGKELLKNGNLLQNFDVLSSNDVKFGEKTVLEFITPLRIKFNGRFVHAEDLRFTHFARNLIRRLSLISYFYGKEWKIDFKRLVNETENIDFLHPEFNWANIERYSMRSKTFMPMGGIIGEATLPESAQKFGKLIELGRYTQVGKNTSFGQGYYILK